MAELGNYLSFYIALMSSIQVVSSTETERQRLLSAGRPTGYAAVAEEAGSKAGEKKHFNLVGLSVVDFWLLVRRAKTKRRDASYVCTVPVYLGMQLSQCV
jgi:hypothetical protein